ncbi:deoxyribonuclease-1 [Caerostris extrusa]|uniref:Deoxyribonuclease-1 n=1 Tax=Caerostris extrusa TaxID=172846 RepID=A0AAV4XV73_CAEEX|nr:deoxyribonuclease-1 [Caerostris extrusa]
MGDFNAACDYVKERHWDDISLWTREEFTWAISQKEDTTTNYRSCALDRIVYAGENMNAGVILSSAQAFDYREEFNIPIEEVRAISDHWPIEVKIRGKMSIAAEKHLTSNTCFTVRDSRKPNIAEEKILNVSKASHFTATVLPSGISLSNETNEFDDMIGAISGFRKALPNAMTREQQEAVLFKANNGALGDASSYADEPDAVYKVTVSVLKNCTEVLVCRATTVN